VKTARLAFETERHAIKIYPWSVLAHMNLGKIYMDHHQYKEAHAEFMELMSRCFGQPDSSLSGTLLS